MAVDLSLNDREGIPDALYRCIEGIDFNDEQRYRSAWVDGEDTMFRRYSDDGAAEHEIKGMNALVTQLLAYVGPMDTQHFVSGIRIDHTPGENEAHMEAYGMNRHFRKGEGMNPASTHFTSGTKHFIDLQKDTNEGIWRMKTWNMKVIWTEGDVSVMAVLPTPPQ